MRPNTPIDKETILKQNLNIQQQSPTFRDEEGESPVIPELQSLKKPYIGHIPVAPYQTTT